MGGNKIKSKYAKNTGIRDSAEQGPTQRQPHKSRRVESILNTKQVKHAIQALHRA
ncbi:hypothetical protein B0H10DRAFT_1986685 [Mycena sp. CBHHK59/15]|nr:hypothetical protein B0H10DRAFT_1986685 [Mycena sp. CBHHK59/15]